MDLVIAIALSISTANAANVEGTLGCAERALGLYVPDHTNVLEDYQCEGGGFATMSSSEVIYELDVGETPVTVRIANGTASPTPGVAEGPRGCCCFRSGCSAASEPNRAVRSRSKAPFPVFWPMSP